MLAEDAERRVFDVTVKSGFSSLIAGLAAPGAAGPFGGNGTPGGGSYDPASPGVTGQQGAPRRRSITGSQPRLGLTGPQARLSSDSANGNPGTNGSHGPNGTGGTGYEPTITWTTPPGGGYGLPDDRDLL